MLANSLHLMSYLRQMATQMDIFINNQSTPIVNRVFKPNSDTRYKFRNLLDLR